jgi:predicted TIM-barrel fold metal-dependent hydrolase
MRIIALEDNLPLSRPDKEKIARGNAERVLRM